MSAAVSSDVAIATVAESALVAERRARLAASGAASNNDAIPVISLTPFIGASGSQAERAAVAAQWDEACRNVGFVKVVDHGVSPSVIGAAWDAAAAFFALPLEEKATVAMTSDGYPYGYQGMGMENLQASLDEKAGTNPGDIKEMFNLCSGPLTADASLPPVRWPAVYPESRRAALQEYYRELEALSARYTL